MDDAVRLIDVACFGDRARDDNLGKGIRLECRNSGVSDDQGDFLRFRHGLRCAEYGDTRDGTGDENAGRSGCNDD